MKRLTEYMIPETGFSVVSEEKYKRILMEEKPSVEKVYNRLKKIEDILGDEYDLDRLRELAQAGKKTGGAGARPQTPQPIRPGGREQMGKIEAEWVQDMNRGPAVFYCSSCGESFEIHSYEFQKYRFCPYCMAPMTDEAVQMVVRRLGR